MIFGAILAGGTGTRMQMENMPKQFLPLGEKPIIIHTLEKFLLCTRFDAVVLGVHPSWLTYMHDLLDKHIVRKEKVRIIAGGEDRNSTLFNAADGIEQEFGADDSHIIVTHDAVRPFISLRIIEENIDCALNFGACNTVLPATDTIVESADGRIISSIPLRKNMYQGQTPQTFRLKHLKTLYNKLTDEEKKELTDACKIYVMNGEPVRLVMGDYSNFKITTINDYKTAQAMIGEFG